MKNGCTMKISKIKSDSKYFFRYADKHRKAKKSIGPLDTGKDEFTSDPKEMCNLLQHQYLKVFSNPSLSNQQILIICNLT